MTSSETAFNDEELNKTLIARLRDMNGGWASDEALAAADRIELLATTNEQLVATNEALSISNATLIAERDALQAWKRYWSGEYDTVLAGRADEYERAEAAEAKLAKAIDLLHRHCDPWGMNDFDATTLAEFKSGVATTPYGLEGESHE